MESREHKARGKGQEHKKDPRLRTDLLEAKDTMRKCSPKKRSSLKKNGSFPRISGVIPKKKSSEIFREVSGLLQQDEKKNGLDLGPFLTNQKMVLSRTGHFCRVLESKAGRFRGFAGFEA